MSAIRQLTHEFVDSFPKQLEEGTVYVSVKFASAIHLCCCGCGMKVVTPISPAAWKLVFNGEAISLKPSIGNWSFPCKSHYWIIKNKVRWAESWSINQIEYGRRVDAMARENAFAEKPLKEPLEKSSKEKKSLFEKLKEWGKPRF